MDFSKNELKAVWARTDEYYRFRYEEYSSFAARLRKWRELNDISQMEMATALFDYRAAMGLEDEDVAVEIIKKEYATDKRYKSFDYEKEKNRLQKRNRRIMSLMHTYHKWESKEMDSSFADTPFSMAHLRILKQILECDYEFLFCEINTPHKYTYEIADRTGLGLSTVEKLLSYDKSYISDGTQSDSALYSHWIITALDKLLSDDDLMTYISWYLTNPERIIEEDDEENEEEDSEEFNTIMINRPVAGVSTMDAYLDGTSEVLDSDDIHLIYMITLANKLSRLKDKEIHLRHRYREPLPSFDRIILAEDDDSFGGRLRKWREYKHYTQEHVAEIIYKFRKDNNYFKRAEESFSMPEKESILRTYQNWERKNSDNKDIRISMTDLYILKNITGCDYEYLFGDINSMKVSKNRIYQSIGLSEENIKKLESYVKSLSEVVKGVPAYAANILATIDLIVSDNELLANLAYYLSDMPFYPNMRLCSILKPSKIMGVPYPSNDAYSDYLFPENNEMRNVFLPKIFNSLKELRRKNIYRYI